MLAGVSFSRSPCSTHGPHVSHPPTLRFRLHHGQFLEASIIVPEYIDACLLPYYPLFSFHTQTTTSLNLHTSKHQEPPLDSLNPFYYPTTHHPNTNFFSQCLPCSSSLLALVLPQTGLFLLFPSESSTTSDEFAITSPHQRFTRKTCLHARRACQSVHLSAAHFQHCTCIDLIAS